jgi:hypothetical protein
MMISIDNPFNTNNERKAANKKKAAMQVLSREDQLQDQVKNYTNPNQGGFQLSGTLEEREKAQSGLDFAKTGYGQNIFDIGGDIQRVRDLQRSRTEGGDPVSAAIRGQKAGSIANAQRNLAASGVKGGAAAGAIDEIARRQDADIAASLYGQQRQNIADERSLASNMLAGTTALMQGSRAEGAAANMPKAPETSGFMGTVICTELYKQGYLNDDIFLKDIAYGIHLRRHKPHVYYGYRIWAGYVVEAMKKSKLVTKLVAKLAIPWALNMSGEYNTVGNLVSFIGEPICGLIGLITRKLGVQYVRKTN